MKRRKQTPAEEVGLGEPMLVALAALAYDLNAEYTSPSPDYGMRRVVLDRLDATVRHLTVEQRQFLAREAGR